MLTLRQVNELTVPLERLEEATLEAEKLPSIEITELDLQWIQVDRPSEEYVGFSI
jgi:hypothetical protein